MKPLDIEEVCAYVNTTIENFHARRLQILSKLTLKQLVNKNPYLFRAKNITKASELIEGTLDAFLSSSEEKLFGDFLEDLAVFVAGKTINGHKSIARVWTWNLKKTGSIMWFPLNPAPIGVTHPNTNGWQRIFRMQKKD